MLAQEAAMFLTLQAASLVLFASLVVVAGAKDLTSYTIPNWISLALLGGFPVLALSLGFSPSQIGVHAGVGFAALLIGMGMFAAGWIGGGDAKLFAAGALWLGWPGAIPYVVFTGLAGGVLTSGLLSLRSPLFRPMALAGPPWMAKLAEPRGDIPYGVAIAVGALAALPGSDLLKGLPLPF